jgi:hypothetical protein
MRLFIALHLWLFYGLPGDYMKFGLRTAWQMAGDIREFRREWGGRP